MPLNSIDNSPLIQVMGWYQTVDKLLPEPMMTQFTDADMAHQAKELNCYRIRNNYT